MWLALRASRDASDATTCAIEGRATCNTNIGWGNVISNAARGPDARGAKSAHAPSARATRHKDRASQGRTSLFSLTTNNALPYTSCNIIASPCEAGL
jgi:hypothetical protein